MKSKHIYIIAILLFLFLCLPLLSDAEVMNDYVLTPPFISTIVPPNILLVLDVSGSMQFPAYLGCDWNYYSSSRARCDSDTSTTDPDSNYDYDYSADEPVRDYYGYFDPEKYYEYDSGNSKFIESASVDCSFTKGAPGYKIGDDSGSCISGNVLNWAAMSRIDLLRKALIGGKLYDPVTAPDTLQGEGGWRTFTDENLDCTFDLSGGTWPDLDHVLSISTAGGSVCTPDTVYSDDFNDTTVDAKWTAVDIGDASGGSESEDGAELNVRSTGSSIWNNSDSFRYVYQSVSGDFDIRLRVIDPPNTNDNAKAALMVRNTNAADSAHVMIAHRGHGSWDERLQFAYRDTTGGSTSTFNSNIYRRSPEWVRLVRTGNTFMAYYSNAGTVWTYVASVTVTDMSDPVLIGIANASYSSSYGTGEYDEFVYCATVAGGCAVGTLSDALIRVDTDDRTGVVQDIADTDGDGLYDENSPRFGVEVFAGNDRYGCIREGFTKTLAEIISAIEDEVPYSGTPTGEALEEAWDYFAQSDAHSSNCDSAVIAPATIEDPFYADDPANPGSVMPVPCKAGYVLLISDGEWNKNVDPVIPARESHINDIRPITNPISTTSLSGKQIIDYYSFFIFGSAGEGRNSMQQIAMYGAFDDFDGNTWPYDRTGYPAWDKIDDDPYGSRDVALPFGTPPNTICDTENLPMDSACKEWDNPPRGVNPDGKPDTYFEAESGKELEEKLVQAISDILRKEASGTAASVLSSSEGSGSNILQAVFYPKLIRFASEVKWTATLQNLWYYSDPYFAGSIREDTDEDKILDLKKDYVARYYFDADPDKQETRVELYEDTEGDGSNYDLIDDIAFENVKSLWETGLLLWKRDLLTNPRNIKTSIGSGLMDFTDPLNISTLRPYLKAADDAEAEAIIRYIHGEDTIPGGGFAPAIAGFTGTYRSRTFGLDLNGDTDADDPGEEPKVWKLADVINSTPKVASWVPLNLYDEKYLDATYTSYINSSGSYCSITTTQSCNSDADCPGAETCIIVNDADYKNRGLVFTGGNGGIFHAFKFGKLQLRESPDWDAEDDQRARLLNIDTDAVCDPANDAVPCGEELWAFIPKNVLPYLRYNADTAYDHIFNIDGTPYIFDASIGDDADVVRASDGSSWRTVVVGRMNYGGACRAAGSGCSNCVEAPGVDLNGDGDTDDPGEGAVGMSSFFAIDITDPDPDNWTLLWEFSHEELGFSTADPAIVRISSKDISGDPERNTNGNWYVVLGSGPTGPIDTTVHQFMGRSDQNLRLFVLDLRTGNLLSKIDTGITNAFAGSMVNSTVDPVDPDTMYSDYEDDAFYFGYTNSANGVGNSFTDGGVLRVLTNEDDSPGNWVVSKVMENIGPVTSSVDRLEDINSGKLWLYFGTGRYFYKLPNLTDDPASQRTLYGIKEPCYSGGAFKSISDCASESLVTNTDLQDATSDAGLSEDLTKKGWYIDLDAQNFPVAGNDAERVITNPVASTSKVVYFTTIKPLIDICGSGGMTHLWGVEYNTGGSASDAGLTTGTALMQVSTGQIKELTLEEVFGLGTAIESRNNRRSPAIDGLAPAGSGVKIIVPPSPLENIIHIMER